MNGSHGKHIDDNAAEKDQTAQKWVEYLAAGSRDRTYTISISTDADPQKQPTRTGSADTT